MSETWDIQQEQDLNRKRFDGASQRAEKADRRESRSDSTKEKQSCSFHQASRIGAAVLNTNRLGCSHGAIKKWLNDHRYVEKRPTKEPNGAYLVEKYKPWIKYHGLSGKESQDDSEPSKSQQLKDDLLEIKVEQEREKLEKIRGSLIERDLVTEVYGKCVAYIFREFDRVFGDEIPPRTRGLTEKQQSALNRKELRAVFQQAKESFSNGMVE